VRFTGEGGGREVTMRASLRHGGFKFFKSSIGVAIPKIGALRPYLANVGFRFLTRHGYKIPFSSRSPSSRLGHSILQDPQLQSWVLRSDGERAGLALMIFLCSSIVTANLSVADEPSLGMVGESLTENAAPAGENGSQKPPAIIFIPGILGSSLVRNSDDRTIWGKHPAEASLLVIDPEMTKNSPDVRAEVLDNYQTPFGEQSVYGKALDLMRRITVAREDVYLFAYDWRRDIRQAAKEFDTEVLKGKDQYGSNSSWGLDQRNVVIIAHSMGGLVAWWWLQEFYRDNAAGQYPFHVRRLILLGTPLRGSCEMARMLFDGYQDIPSHSYGEGANVIVYRAMYEYFFSNFKSAAFTFPSIFQLLPSPSKYNATLSCLRDQSVSDGKPIDYFNPDTWDKIKNRAFYELVFKDKPWQKVGMKEALFIERVKKAALLGGQFRSQLKAIPNLKLTLFGNTSHPTVEQISLEWVKGCCLFWGSEGYKIVYTIPPNTGDGRVLGSSSRPVDLENADRRYAAFPHGDLVEDGSFLDYLANNLESELRADPRFKKE